MGRYQGIKPFVCPRLPSGESLIVRDFLDDLVIALNLGFGAGGTHNDTRSVGQEIRENITTRKRDRGLGVGIGIVSSEDLRSSMRVIF